MVHRIREVALSHESLEAMVSVFARQTRPTFACYGRVEVLPYSPPRRLDTSEALALMPDISTMKLFLRPVGEVTFELHIKREEDRGSFSARSLPLLDASSMSFVSTPRQRR